MADRSRPHMSVGVQFSTKPQSEHVAEPDSPFRIALFGDFSARSQRITTSTAGEWTPRAVVVDRDNYEDVLEKLDVELRLPDPTGSLTEFTLRFREIEDFHPDEIYRRAEIFRSLADLRDRISDPATFAAAAREIQSWSSPDAAPVENEPPPPSDPAQLLNQMIVASPDEAPADPTPPATARDTLKQLLSAVVSEHLIPAEDPRQDAYLAQIDAAIAAHMRAVLHHPDFQTLEAAWRSVHFLIRRLETDENLKLYLIDCSKQELRTALTSSTDLASTGLYKFLVDEAVGTQGADPWALWIGDYQFTNSESDLTLLAHIAPVAAAAGAPFLAGASPSFIGADTLHATPDPDDWNPVEDIQHASAWNQLRSHPTAAYVGLVLPRFLGRLPYGPDHATVESFDFDELHGVAEHESLLWLNPAVACAALLGESFAEDGWSLRPDDTLRIANLPLYVFNETGAPEVHPTAEILLTDRAVERVLDTGLMPLVSVKDADAAQLARFQSIADPPTPLAGRWSS